MQNDTATCTLNRCKIGAICSRCVQAVERRQRQSQKTELLKRHDGNACTLAKHPEVQVRLEEIRGGLAANPLSRTFRSGVTAESLLDEAEAVRVQAMESGQLNAAVAAIKEKGVLSGKRVERSEVGGPGQFDHLSDEELRAEIVREVRELGLVLVESSERKHEGDCSKK